MRLTLAYPENGTQIVIDIDEPQILANLYDHRLGEDIDGAVLGEQFKGYLFRLGGGFDKQGFPMKQGVLTPRRLRLLLRGGTSCYRPRKDGERKRKTVRGCIVSQEISALHLIVLQRGEQEIENLTNKTVPRLYGPKRANKLLHLFGKDKKTDPTTLVIKHQVKPDKFTTPKVQRLITDKRLQRKKRMLDERKARKEASARKAQAYKDLLAKQAQKK